jgi:hypothetical protein
VFPDSFLKLKIGKHIVGLIFFNRDGVSFTNFDAAFATQAFFGVNGHGLPVLHLEYFNRAYIYTFFATFTFVCINNRIKSHLKILLSWEILFHDGLHQPFLRTVRTGKSPYTN